MKVLSIETVNLKAMNVKIFIIGIVLAGCILSSCNKGENSIDEKKWENKITELYQHNEQKISITEGTSGTLTLTEGNCMPVISDGGNNSCKEYPVKRTIKVYEYTKLEQTNHEITIFHEVNTKLITTIVCDEEGFFQVSLPAGVYSLFIEEKGTLYANSFDGYGGIQPVLIEPEKVSKIYLRIDYAVY
ncbi:MAG: hypothetical protein LBT50_11330 [Prevotellaceae bacterium]|jgi:hypothetical protein|nr:hypothetical protein [Prevotellaceae bacterium]